MAESVIKNELNWFGVHPPYYRPKSVYNKGSVVADGERTELDITGEGILQAILVEAEGLAGNASFSGFSIYIDDEVSPSVILPISSVCFTGNYPTIHAGAVCPFSGCTRYDTGGKNGGCFWSIPTIFTTGLRIEVFNGDAADATSIYSLILYSLKPTS
jgi:hypothetical protein